MKFRIVGTIVVLIAATLIAFGPTALESYEQKKRDNSLGCSVWCLKGSLLDLRDTEAMLGNGSPVTSAEWEKHERERKKLGCSAE